MNSKLFTSKGKSTIIKISSPINFYDYKKTQNFFSLSPDFYTKTTGFFCRQELKFEKATAIPLRFRLGSVGYTDYLEQKPNALGK